MCDKCKKSIQSKLFRSVGYGAIRYGVDRKPIKNIFNILPGTRYKLGMKGLQMKTIIHLGGEFIYDYIYEMLPKMTTSMWGICPCEFMENLYLVMIELLYDYSIDGSVSIRDLGEEAAAVFGSDLLNKMIEKP